MTVQPYPVTEPRDGAQLATSVRRSPAPTGGSGAARDDDDLLGEQLQAAGRLIDRAFRISLGLRGRAAAGGPACELVDGVVERLDRLIVDVRLAVFAAQHRGTQPAGEPASEIGRATQALDAALDDLSSSATRLLGSEVVHR